MTVEHEEEIIACDLQRMDTLKKRPSSRTVYLDECNIFTIAHAEAHGVHKVSKHWDSYIKRLSALSAKVIFLDIPPETSWERRRRRYEQRLVYFPVEEHEHLMASYENYLGAVYPLLKKVYHQLPFPKRIIDATMPTKSVLENVSRALSELSDTFK